MKRISTVFLIILVSFSLVGCSNPFSSKEKDDMLNFLAQYNQAVVFEQKSVEQYALAVDKLRDNKTREGYKIISEQALPNMEEFVSRVENINPQTKEVRALQEQILAYGNTAKVAIKLVMTACERNDSKLAIESSEKVDTAKRLKREYMTNMQELMEKNKIDVKQIPIVNQQAVSKPPSSSVATPVSAPVTPTPIPIKSDNASITGDDVFCRDTHSIAAQEVAMLKSGDRVTVLDKWASNDPNEAVVSRDGLYANYNGRQFAVAKGQAVSVAQDLGWGYRVMVTIDGQKIYQNCDKDMIRKVFGENWYKVKLSDGREGWVFGQFVRQD